MIQHYFGVRLSKRVHDRGETVDQDRFACLQEGVLLPPWGSRCQAFLAEWVRHAVAAEGAPVVWLLVQGWLPAVRKDVSLDSS